jgi:eukaryotic-like serine/threonine-protein kinase
LAVVPFATVGEASTSQSFCDGLLETLTSRLTQLEQFQEALWVIPASEVREYKISSARQARKAFGVTLAVTGSMQRTEDKVRVTVNLVDAKSEHQLRSLVIDDDAANMSALQDSVVFELAAMLQITLGNGERRLLTAGGTTDAEAYDLYLQGCSCLQRRGKLEAIDTAITLFQRAIAKDPGYALAVAGLGDAYWRRYTMSEVPQCIEQAAQYCQRAIRLDSRLAFPHLTLGRIHMGSGHYEEAIREFELALQLDPLSHRAYRGLAGVYEAQNDFARAEGTYKKAIELKPDYWMGYRDLELFYLSHGRHKDALQYLDKLIALNPEGFASWNDLGAVYYKLDDHDKAKRALKRSIEIDPNYAAYSNLGTLYYMSNQYDDAARTYERALELDNHDYQVWVNLASSYQWVPDQHSKAESTFRRAIEMAERERKINPHDPQLLSNLAQCYAALGESTAALPLIEEALSRAPENLDILLRAGAVYEQLGRRELALECIGSALKLGLPVSSVESLSELSDLRSDPRCRQLLKRSTNGQGNKADVKP